MIHVDSIQLPEAWGTAEAANQDSETYRRTDTGEEAHFLSIVLKDGTNIHVLHDRKGSRCLRMGPDTDWSIQEHMIGKPSKTWKKVWKKIVQATIESKHTTDPSDPPDWFNMGALALCNDDLFEEIYQHFCETNRPISREIFRAELQEMMRTWNFPEGWESRP